MMVIAMAQGLASQVKCNYWARKRLELAIQKECWVSSLALVGFPCLSAPEAAFRANRFIRTTVADFYHTYRCEFESVSIFYARALCLWGKNNVHMISMKILSLLSVNDMTHMKKYHMDTFILLVSPISINDITNQGLGHVA